VEGLRVRVWGRGFGVQGLFQRICLGSRAYRGEWVVVGVWIFNVFWRLWVILFYSSR
jgi:hypothetical protein